MDSFGLIRRSPGAGDSGAPSFNATFANLARSYGIIVREISELMAEMRDPVLRQENIAIDANKMERLENFVDESLKRTWGWVCQVMDSTEAQLRFGYALQQSSDAVPVHNQRERGGSSRDYEDPRTAHGHPSSHRKQSRGKYFVLELMQRSLLECI